VGFELSFGACPPESARGLSSMLWDMGDGAVSGARARCYRARGAGNEGALNENLGEVGKEGIRHRLAGGKESDLAGK